MPPDYALCLENLHTLIDSMPSGELHRNEATTRLQLIDSLLFDCLGWQKSECVAEESYDGTFADYSLGTPQNHLIVEAKKEDIYFTLPLGFSHLTYNIEMFKQEARDVYSAIQQAVKYCQSRGVPFGAVSNGHQLVAFLASRTDGVPPLLGKALVFPSLFSMASNFKTVWDCLSSVGVAARGLPLVLQGTDERPPPDKLSMQIRNYPRFQVRNMIQTNLQVFGELILEDVGNLPENKERFLKECYAKSGALSQYALVSRSILQSRYSQEFEESLGGPSLAAASRKSGEPAITSEVLAQSATKRPVLLIGDVGVGKTMFVRHLIAVDAADLLDKAIVLYLDFGTKPTFTSDLAGYLEGEINRQLLEDYDIDLFHNRFVQGVYHFDLSRFEHGIYGVLRDTDYATYQVEKLKFLQTKLDSPQEHLRRSLDHLSKARQQQIVIFLDNVDQRPEDFQQEAFLIGQSMAELWPALVFVALRPETYHRSRLQGTLSAYHVKAFTISPPRIDRVIQKRLLYAIQLLEGGLIGHGLDNIEIDANLQDLAHFLRILEFSFRVNTDLVEFVDNVCGGNVRIALDIISIFLGSGHPDTPKMLEIYRETGKYLLPLHEVLRAVIYGDYRDYDPRLSEIINLFDIGSLDGTEHFLSSIILAFVEIGVRESDHSSYVSAESVYRYAQGIGFRPEQVEQTLRRLLRHKLIETEKREAATNIDVSKDAVYRITTVGSYYYRRLIGKFTYCDAMVVDTPIVERGVRETTKDETTILGRLARAEAFRQYLDSQWTKIRADVDCFDWNQQSSLLREEIAAIQHRVNVVRTERSQGTLPTG